MPGRRLDRANLSEQREGEQGKNPPGEVPSVEERISARDKKNTGEGEKGFPKDLYVNLENCSDLSVKHKFSINLKPK
jgi:hypothetical protein